MRRLPATLVATALLLIGAGLVTATQPPVRAGFDHAAAAAKDMAAHAGRALGHSGADASVDRQCDQWRNHGEYVSHVANATRPDGNESAGGNETEDNETGDAHDAHGQAVRDAARSDIGKCGGRDAGNESQAGQDEENETADGRGHQPRDDEEGEEAGEAGSEGPHGRSEEARDEHPPRR